jgi:uncharacterized membrane protein
MAQASGKLHKVEEDISSPAQEKEGEYLSRIPRRVLSISQFFVSRSWILCVLIGGIALVSNLYQLGSRGLWFDEILSVYRAEQSLPILLQIDANTQSNMALYYVLLHFWLNITTLFGLLPIEFVVRLPSAIFAALSSIMVFLLGRRFLGLIAGIASAGIYVLNYLQLLYAQEARSYALQLLLICISWYALFALLTSTGWHKRWWIIYSVMTILAIYIHLFSLLILTAQVVAFAGLLLLPGPWRSRARSQLCSFIASLLAVGLVIAPLLYASRHGSKTGWLPIPHLQDIYTLFLNIGANSKPYTYVLLTFCLLGLMGALLASSSLRVQVLRKFALVEVDDDQRAWQLRQLLPLAFALLCWIIVPIILSYVISQGSTRLFSSRYLVTIVPSLMLLVGVGITVIRWRTVQCVLTLGLLLLTLRYAPYYYQLPQVEDWNTATFWLEQHYQANDGLVCYDNAEGCEVSVEYYLTAYPSAAHFTSDSPGSFPWVNYDLTNRVGNALPAVDAHALSIFASHHPRVFYIVGRISSSAAAAHARFAQHWLDTHYHLVGQILTRTVSVRLYETG